MSVAQDIPPYVQQLVRNKVFTPTALKLTSITGGNRNEYEYNLEWYEEPAKRAPITTTQPMSSPLVTSTSVYTTPSSSTATRHSSWDRIVRNDIRIADDDHNNSERRCSSCVIL